MAEDMAKEVAAMRRQLDDMAKSQDAFQKELRALLGKSAAPLKIGDAAAPPAKSPAGEASAKTPSAPPTTMEASGQGDVAQLADCAPKPSVESQMKRGTTGPTEEEVKDMLKSTLELAEAEEARMERLVEERKNKVAYIQKTIRSFDAEQAELTLDSVMGFIIFANAVFIGFSRDMDDKSAGWLVADVFFSASFLVELCLKLRRHGVREHFLKNKGNILDGFLVFIDVLQLVMLLAGFDDNSGVPSASLFRLVRLLKLGRVLSVLRTEVFSDLISMIQGMMGGMTTLVWSMVLFFLTVYMVALLFREFFGRTENETVYQFFSSTPRSIFTTFRCSFGDCSSAGGTPLLEHIQTEYGAASSIFCCAFVFVVTIGLFNVISAIFVESTMVAAMSLETKKRRERLADRKLWSTRITTLLRRVLVASPDHEVPDKMSAAIEDLYAIDLPGAIINKFVKDPEAIEALDDLEIDPEDHAHLSDILDPDNSGSIGLKEFVEGLGRLRGVPRRSDIVTVDLMVRSVQAAVHDIQEKVEMLVDARICTALC